MVTSFMPRCLAMS